MNGSIMISKRIRIDNEGDIDVGKIKPEVVESMFGKNIKSKLEDLLEEKIQVFFQNKAKESKSIYNKEFEMLYVNHVLIRFYKDLSFSQNTELDNNFFNANGLFEKSEQKFRINSETTFEELKKFA